MKKFTKAQKILRAAEYQNILNNGERILSRHFILFFSKNNEEHNRLGMIVSRKAGNAVVRNRVKRVVREYFRLFNSLDSHQKIKHDLVFISKKNMGHIDLQTVSVEMKNVYEKNLSFFDSPLSVDLARAIA